MIAMKGRKRLIGKDSFRDAVDYIRRTGRYQRSGERPLYEWSRGICSWETAAVEMQAVAALARHDCNALYHLILSWSEKEVPSFEDAGAALGIAIKGMGFQGLQYIATLQNDGKRGLYHIHTIVNRVDPIRGTARVLGDDYVKLREIAQTIERLFGLRQTRDIYDESAQGAVKPIPPLRSTLRDLEKNTLQRSFERKVLEDIAPDVRAFLSEKQASWEGLHALLARHGVRYTQTLRHQYAGGILEGRVPGERTRAGSMGQDLTHPRLLERLGPYSPGATKWLQAFEIRANAAAHAVLQLSSHASWRAAHDVFERYGVAYERHGHNARILNLDGVDVLRASTIDKRLRLVAMQSRFGPYQSSAIVQELAKQREQIHLSENALIGARLIANFTPLLDTLLSHKATFEMRELRQACKERVLAPEQRKQLMATILEQCIALEGDEGEPRFTTPAILAEERSLREKARDLAMRVQHSKNNPNVSTNLQGNLRAAHDYATDSGTSLKLILGVSDSERMRLIQEIAQTYESAGYRVRGTTLTKDALDRLRWGTNLPVRLLSSEISSLEEDQLTSADVVLIDEIAMLGTSSGARLLEKIHAGGAVAIGLGSDRLHYQPAPRGDALRLLREALNGNMIIFEEKVRQRKAWMREAADAVRAGRIADSLHAYKKHGYIHMFDSDDKALEALADYWKEIEAYGIPCGITAFTSRDRLLLREAIRQRCRELGFISGQDVFFETMEGHMPYAKGDRVIIHEAQRSNGSRKCSFGTVIEIQGKTLSIRKAEDNTIVFLDTTVRKEVEHAYGSMEARHLMPYGFELMLVHGDAFQAHLCHGMAQNKDGCYLFLSRESFSSFDDFVKAACRRKEVAGDYRIIGPAGELMSKYLDEDEGDGDHGKA